MSEIIAFNIMLICMVGLLICLLQMIRLNFLSNEVLRRINETYTNRTKSMREGTPFAVSVDRYPYPDLDKTYNNFKWYTPWKSPSSMIVYEG